jgi:hypothetical protein
VPRTDRRGAPPRPAKILPPIWMPTTTSASTKGCGGSFTRLAE